MPVLATDLQTYLGLDTIDTGRATYLIGLATQLCQSIVNPLPDGSDAVVAAVAARAYTNPASVTQESTGPFSANYGPVGGGVKLTKQEERTLRRLAGGGGAFTFDVMPTTAGQNLPPWDAGSGTYEGWGSETW